MLTCVAPARDWGPLLPDFSSPPLLQVSPDNSECFGFLHEARAGNGGLSGWEGELSVPFLYVAWLLMRTMDWVKCAGRRGKRWPRSEVKVPLVLDDQSRTKHTMLVELKAGAGYQTRERSAERQRQGITGYAWVCRKDGGLKVTLSSCLSSRDAWAALGGQGDGGG